jgi:integrase
MKALNPDSTYVFEGTRPGQPLSDMTLTKVLRDAGLADEATVHGFRSTFKDWCAERDKVPDEVSEAALSHVEKNSVKAAYLRTTFLDERRLLMERWAIFCGSGQINQPVQHLDI